MNSASNTNQLRKRRDHLRERWIWPRCYLSQECGYTKSIQKLSTLMTFSISHLWPVPLTNFHRGIVTRHNYGFTGACCSSKNFSKIFFSNFFKEFLLTQKSFGHIDNYAGWYHLDAGQSPPETGQAAPCFDLSLKFSKIFSKNFAPKKKKSDAKLYIW